MQSMWRNVMKGGWGCFSLHILRQLAAVSLTQPRSGLLMNIKQQNIKTPQPVRAPDLDYFRATDDRANDNTLIYIHEAGQGLPPARIQLGAIYIQKTNRQSILRKVSVANVQQLSVQQVLSICYDEYLYSFYQSPSLALCLVSSMDTISLSLRSFSPRRVVGHGALHQIDHIPPVDGHYYSPSYILT